MKFMNYLKVAFAILMLVGGTVNLFASGLETNESIILEEETKVLALEKNGL